jgi:hypothetical protein
MNALVSACREVVGLFVDDGLFALAIVGVIVLAALLAILLPGVPLAAGALLLVGSLAVLLAECVRASRL